MRIPLPLRLFVLLSFVALLLTGCTSQTAQLAPGGQPLAYQPAASAVAPCAQSALVAPQVQPLALAPPTGVRFTVGGAEYARAALAIPGGLVACGATAIGKAGLVLAEFLTCAGQSLIPTPVPTQTLVWGQSVAPAAAPRACPAPPPAPAAFVAPACESCPGGECAPTVAAR